MLRLALLCTTLLCVLLRGIAAKPRVNKLDQCPARFQSCPEIKPDFINVHLIPHTHNDLGWLKTVDQYYYGSHNDIQRAGVQYILDAVVQELIRDPSKRFVWVETAFLWQWWEEQEEPLREQVRKLVNSGQLEIVGGGWSMNDEAVTHYQSVIDQFTWGFRRADEMFGVCGRPHLGWQLDTFGHSSETASLMAQFGFDAFFFARLDSNDKARRLAQKEMEFVWKSSPNLGRSSWLFTHVMFAHYSAPDGLCFDLFCNDAPIIDNLRSPEYNLEEKVQYFITYVLDQKLYYKTNNVMEMMGNDFNYQVSGAWFKNMDKLIKYVNARQKNGSRVNVFYSTPSCYLKAVHDANITSWPSNQYDFFPYANNGFDFWTGYYTSRPTLKYFERLGNNLLQSVKRFSILAGLTSADNDVTTLRDIMGILQHHDAITGTEKQHVANDYAFRLDRAMSEAHETMETATNKLMAKSDNSPIVAMETCLLLNISQCFASERSNSFVVTIFNPLARPISRYIRLPVTEQSFIVTDHAGDELEVQIVPIPEHVLTIPGRSSDAMHELVFRAEELPALGFKSYHVQYVEDNQRAHLSTVEKKTFIGNQRVQVHLNVTTGRISNVTVDDKLYSLQQNLKYYESSYKSYVKSSGAYMFRPQEGQDPITFNDPVNITVYSVGSAADFTISMAMLNLSTVSTVGMNSFLVPCDFPKLRVYSLCPLVEEIHQNFSDWVYQVIRVYRDEAHFELEWQVGPISDKQAIGKEVISWFSTGWDTDGKFFTDSNGREMIERQRDFRPTWTLEQADPVSSNYYPVTSLMAMKTYQSELAVITDRAQGASSMSDGDLEIMVHRRVFQDDQFGVEEPLNEMAFDYGLVARGRHVVILGSNHQKQSVRAQQRILAQSHSILSPWLLFATTDLTSQQWRETYITQYSGLVTSLPDNIHLLTLEPWRDDSVLLRLEHFFEKSDDEQHSKPATVQLKDIFTAFKIVKITEMTLGGNEEFATSERMDWHTTDSETMKESREILSKMNNFTVTLTPMQIRTFVIQIQPKQ